MERYRWNWYEHYSLWHLHMGIKGWLGTVPQYSRLEFKQHMQLSQFSGKVTFTHTFSNWFRTRKIETKLNSITFSLTSDSYILSISLLHSAESRNTYWCNTIILHSKACKVYVPGEICKLVAYNLHILDTQTHQQNRTHTH